MRLSVWAPDAQQVRAHIGKPGSGNVADMEPRGDSARPGWWDGPELPHGADYAFEVDGNGPFPDPRSAWQPQGVHGPSRVFDPGTFAWTDGDWAGVSALGAVQYEMHVGAFTPTGTLDAAQVRLRELGELGVGLVELMPVAPVPGRHGWGYDGVSIFAVHEPYGGPAALQRFVDKAHAKGVGVCLDVVYNHFGPSGNYLGVYGPYFTDAHHTPWGEAVNLDRPGSEEVRRYLIDNALRWFRDFHVDALRLDAVHELKDDSDRHFLAELSDEVAALSEELGRPLALIAESDLNDDCMVTPTADGGLGMTAQWADDIHHALHAYLTGERHGYYVDFGGIDSLDKGLREVFWHNGTYSPFRDRDWGRPVASRSPAAEATAMAIVLLGPFTPMLFMGEEYGETRPFMFFTNHQEPELAQAVTEGRTREFAGHGWEEIYGGDVEVPDPQDPTTFLRSKLGAGVGANSDANRAMERWVETLMSSRAYTLREGAWERRPAGASENADGVLAVTGPVAIYANLTDSAARVACGEPFAVFGDVDSSGGEVLLTPGSVALVATDGEAG